MIPQWNKAKDIHIFIYMNGMCEIKQMLLMMAAAAVATAMKTGKL